MANIPTPDTDDDFEDIYKEYTGPPVLTATATQEKAKGNKRSHASSDDEEEQRDPNAVPTDFTSREAKVWEAKSKATERNWKKRKEEEMICKICGESGHFTQGCPTTLGANSKSQEFFERVPAREKHVKALFTESVVQKIQKDVGCKIKIEEKFIIVSGKDRLCLAKGVDAVHKVKNEEGKKKGSSSQRNRSRSPEESPVGSRLGRSDSQKSYPSHRNTVQSHPKFGRQEKVMEDRIRGDLKQLSRGSPQAYGNDRGRSRASHSRSPGRSSFASGAYSSHDGHTQGIGAQRTDGWDSERRGSDGHPGHKFEYSANPLTLEELESEYKREAMELGIIRDKEEDEENYKHREAIREMRENYMKKLATMRGMQTKQWEEFLQLDMQRRQRARQHMSAPGFDGYSRPNYSDYDRASSNPSFVGANLPMDSRGGYPYPVDNYPPSRPHDAYGEFQRQRHEDYRKTYNRY